MRPLSPAVCRRLPLIAALVAVLVLAGCGGSEGDSSTDDGASTRAQGIKTTTTVGAEDGESDLGPKTGKGASPAGGGKGKRAAAPSCEARLDPLVTWLDRLRVRLATGLSYEQYAGSVKKARAAYAALDVDALPAACLLAAGTPAEKSLNRYIEAANSWGSCLADAGCDGRVVEPRLQRDWQVASHWLSETHAGLEEPS